MLAPYIPSSAISGIKFAGNVPSRLCFSITGSTRSCTKRRTESRTRISSSLKRPSISRKSTPSNFCMDPPGMAIGRAPWRDQAPCSERRRIAVPKAPVGGKSRGRPGVAGGLFGRRGSRLPAGLASGVAREVSQLDGHPLRVRAVEEVRIVSEILVRHLGHPLVGGGVPPVHREILKP